MMIAKEVVSGEFRAETLRRLRAAEAEHDVRIVYACESGSRAWGFHSPDSDYDVRFIYVRPRAWYLSYQVERKRDVIEYPIVDEIDCGGWDVRKVLYLFSRTNGALLEWLKSPMVYIETGGLAQGLRDLEARAVSRTALCYHYSHMARGNARRHLFGDRVRLQKYLYVLRPLLAIRYIEAHNAPPQIEFQALVDAVAHLGLRPAVARLLEPKRNTPELVPANRSPGSAISSRPNWPGTATNSGVKGDRILLTDKRSAKGSTDCSGPLWTNRQFTSSKAVDGAEERT